MALAIDASSPATAVNAVNTVAALTTASFTPPASSLLVILWSGDEQSGGSSTTPTITDSLGTHLTYTLRQWKANGQGTPAVNGQAAIWTAPVTSSAAMTVTITNNCVGNFKDASARVLVLTDTSQPTVGTSSKGGQSTGTAVPMAYTATQTGSWGFAAVCDWDDTATQTAGSGTTQIAFANGVGIGYGFDRRTSADGVNGSATTLNATLSVASANLAWAAIEIKGTAATNPAITFATKRRARPPVAARRGRTPKPVPAQVVITAPATIPASLRAGRDLAAVLRRGHASSVVPAQEAPPVVAGRRPRPVVLRRGRALTPAPAQAVVLTPAVVPTALRAGRRLGALLRRGHVSSFIPDQVVVSAPASVPAALRGGRRLAAVARRGRSQSVAPAPDGPQVALLRRRAPLALRRGRVNAPAPAQVVVLAPASVPVAVRAGRRLGAFLRRGHVSSFIPDQVVVAPPATIPTSLRAGRDLAYAARRGRASVVTPAQVVVAAPASIPAALRGGRRLAAVAKRGHTSSAAPAQASPPVAKVRPPRRAARSIPRRVGRAFGAVAVVVGTQRGTANYAPRVAAGSSELDHLAGSSSPLDRAGRSAGPNAHTAPTSLPATRSEPSSSGG